MNKQRIKTNAVTTAANITYYGGTIGASVAFYSLLDNHNPIAIAVLVVFVIVIEGLLRTLLDEVLNVATPEQDSSAKAAAAATAETEEATR